MKNYTKLLASILLGVMFLNSNALADPFKGGRILGNAVKECPMLLADLAGTHSRTQWEEIVKGGKVEATMHEICPSAKVKPIAKDSLKDVLDYLQYYSKDGGALPSC